jgi:hypothetical protein
MVDVFSAFREAFAAFRKNLLGCLLHTIIFGFCLGVALVLLLSLVFVFSLLSVGSAASLALSGSLSISLVLLGGSLLVLLFGALVLSWLLSGAVASYYESLYSFMSGRKPTIIGFFTFIPRKATPLFLAQFVQGLIIAVPVFALLAIASLAGAGSGLAGILAMGAAHLYSMAIGVLSTFLVASVVLDNKGAIAAIASTFSRVARNLLPTLVYLIAGSVLSLPVIFAIGAPLALGLVVKQELLVRALEGLGVLFSFAYIFLFYLPFIALANLSLYRKLR